MAIDEKKLIDAEETINFIKKNWELTDKDLYSHPKAVELGIGIAIRIIENTAILDGIPLENKTSDWIPCSRELPNKEKSTNVMVTVMDSITGKRWVEEDCYFYGVWCKSRELQENIIAWCEPEPYNGDE